MNLQNGYKVIYEKIADGNRTFLASKTGLFADAEVITEAKIGEYKLIYEKDGRFYGSTTGLPAEDDYCFEDFDKVFKKAEEATEPEVPAVEEPATYTRRSKKAEAEVEEPKVEEQAEEPAEATEVEEEK